MASPPRIKTIRKIHYAYSTGEAPVEVECQDFQTYICKHQKPPSYELAKEYLANRFLKLWGIHVPEIAIVEVQKHHINYDLETILPSLFVNFYTPCLGFKKLSDVRDVDSTFDNFSPYRLAKVDRKSLLMIALFDVWVCNDDRNPSNSNLLIQAMGPPEEYRIIPIDHSKIFNTGNIIHRRGLFELTEEDSYIGSRFFKSLFKKSKKTTQDVSIALNEFESLVETCEGSLKDFFSEMPEEWNIEKDYYHDLIQNALFSPKWIERTKRHFANLIQCLIINKK